MEHPKRAIGESDDWEVPYRALGGQRLWPPDPTIEDLDLDEWHKLGIEAVLDAGCGDGKNLAYLAAKGFYSLGFDVSVSALNNCQSYISGKGLSGRCVLFRPTSLEALPLFEESIHGAICVDVLGHIRNPQLILQELARVMQPKGLLYATVFHIEDSCRKGPRMRPGVNTNEYWYHPTRPDPTSPKKEFYYKFYEEQAARHLFETRPFQIMQMEVRRWNEPGHKGYREEPHEHVSWFGLLRKA